MPNEIGFDLFLPGQYLKAALIISLLSVWVLVGLFFYLNHYTKRRYFTIWAAAWLFYALWLTLNFSLQNMPETPFLMMIKLWCISTVAMFLLWGSARFLGHKAGQTLFGLFMTFLYTWSYYGAYNLDSPMHARLPIFVLISLASLRTAWCFFSYRSSRKYIGAGLLGVGFLLWGLFHAGFPFLFLLPELFGASFFISAVLQLFIAVSMIVLVLEEARQTHNNAFRNLQTKSEETEVLKHRVHSTEERYRNLFDQASEAIVITNPTDLQILDLNRTASQLLGVEVAEGLQHRLTDFLCLSGEETRQTPKTAEEWCQFISRQRPLQIQRKNGTFITTEADGAPVDFSGQPALQFFVRELTERARLEQQLRQSEKLSAMGQMISGVAHELNNPLAVIRGYLELVLARQDLPANTRTDLEKVSQESERASKLVKNFLSFARERQPHRETVNVNEMINRVVELRKASLVKSRVEITLTLSDNVPLTSADPDQIQQILVVLINNALHAMSGVKGRKALGINTESRAGTILITVQDTGPGVPAQLEAKIFEPFFTTKKMGEGTGLGLSIAHSIMTEHNGKIYYRRENGPGACFVIELPIIATIEKPITLSLEAEKFPMKPQHMPRAHILVLDDEKSIADLVSEMLNLIGHKTTVCYTAAEALEEIGRKDFDLIFSDVRMPGMDGPQFYTAAVSKNPELISRVIFLTGDTVSEETNRFFKIINAPNISKPFQMNDLYKVVNQVLEKQTASVN